MGKINKNSIEFILERRRHDVHSKICKFSIINAHHRLLYLCDDEVAVKELKSLCKEYLELLEIEKNIDEYRDKIEIKEEINIKQIRGGLSNTPPNVPILGLFCKKSKKRGVKFENYI